VRRGGILIVATLVALVAPALAQPPTAERPTYQAGDRWTIGGLAYELTGVDRHGYVFTAADGNALHLSRDLTVTKVVQQRASRSSSSGSSRTIRPSIACRSP